MTISFKLLNNNKNGCTKNNKDLSLIAQSVNNISGIWAQFSLVPAMMLDTGWCTKVILYLWINLQNRN